MSICTQCGMCTNSGGNTDRLPSLFDSIGPIMTGPSSSHTAGMVRIGRMCRQLIGGTPDTIDLYFYGALSMTYKGHASDSGVVAGLLGQLEDSPGIKTALQTAKAQGIPVVVHRYPDDTSHSPATVDTELTRNGERYRIVGLTIGGGEIQMSEVDGFPVELHGSEDGVLFSASKAYAAAELSAAVGATFQSCVSTVNDGVYFHTAISDRSLSEDAMAKLKVFASKVYPLAGLWDFKLVNAEPLVNSFDELLARAKASSIPAVAEEFEAQRSGVTREWIRKKTLEAWKTMKASVVAGLGKNNLVAGFMPGDDGAKLMKLVNEGKNLSGPIVGTAVARAIGVMEANGSMCCVCASPTAGSCGVIPGCLLTSAEQLHSSEDQIIDALLVAAMTGVLIAKRAPVSGALGGCQSEIGVASAMAAAGLVQLAGGTPLQCCEAMALALKNILGLICDPVAGPVEIPCIKRNTIGVGNAYVAADMALAGIRSVIPPDEVVDALINTQQLLPRELRGTLIGGLASTKTARQLKDVWYKRMEEMG